MTFTADSPLVAKVVPSPSSEVGPRPGGVDDIRAVAIHMAEGGGTVSWLTRPDGNSSHYVVEYTGRIVQMVAERNWAGSMNPKLTRTDDDKPFTYQDIEIRYGATALKRCLGDGWQNPNRYVIAVEIEGFAKVGPNASQRGSLRALVEDIRKRRGPIPVIGHRDQQNYKACPGRLIPWADYGGHAVTPEEDMERLIVTTESVKQAVIPEDRQLYNFDGTELVKASREFRAVSPLGLRSSEGTYRVLTVTTGGERVACMVRSAGLDWTPPAPPELPDLPSIELTIDGQLVYSSEG